MGKKFNLAVVGATGAVGEAMLSILAERKFPVCKIYALASSCSVGKKVEFGNRWLKVEALDDFDFSKAELALFSAGSGISKAFVPKAVDAGCVVIDDTPCFRYEADIPLVVPEVNPEAIAGYLHQGIVANPSCSTIQMVVALKPIYDAVGIMRINVCTYQAVSSSGKEGIEELAMQTANLLNMKSVDADLYPKQIAFNVLPQIDLFQENGYTREEMKLVLETRKIMGDDAILVNPTAVRVPVFYGHSEALHIETRKKIRAEEARALLAQAAGVTVIDECCDGGYPTAVTDSVGKDATFVGRIREDISHPCGLDMWVVSDNVRKGAALNSVQIAEILVKDYL